MNELHKKTRTATVAEMRKFRESIEATHREEGELYQDLKRSVVTEESYQRMVGQVRNQRMSFTKLL